jgi:chemotaxis protein CheZ
MSDFKDLNELINLARQINEGRYDVIDVSIDPTSELFSIAQYFVDSIKKLKSVSSAVSKSYDSLPAFEQTLKEVSDNNHQASEDVLALVDKINFNIDSIKELLEEIDAAATSGNTARAAALGERLQDLLAEGQEICFDIVSSLEFKELSRQKLDDILEAVAAFEGQISGLILSLGIKKQVIDPKAIDNMKDSKEILQDQNLVNKLLKEFGL